MKLPGDFADLAQNQQWVVLFFGGVIGDFGGASPLKRHLPKLQGGFCHHPGEVICQN